jgi:hypothetical protein
MNPYEARNRTLKALAIADVLAAAHPQMDTDLSCSEFARGLSTETRDMVAAVAGKPVPSDETWAEVVTILERREAASRAVA